MTEWLCYTDGAVKPGDGAPGGWGFYLRPPKGVAVEGFGKAYDALAKVMEYHAVAEAVAALPDGVAAVVHSDNQSLVENLEKRLDDWRRSGFSRVDPDIVADVRAIADHVERRGLRLRFLWVRGHAGNVGNERADQLAAQGAREAKADLEARRRGRR